jgi:hypothetical protein
VTLRAAFERRGRVDEATRAHVAAQFTRAAPYWWMWPFPRQVRRWVDGECARLERGPGPGRAPSPRPQSRGDT